MKKSVIGLALTTAPIFAAALHITNAALAETGPDVKSTVDVAEFDENGSLIFPENFDEWIFMGSSVGLTYSNQTFNPDRPGLFSDVKIEPTAYRIFKKTGEFPQGTMLMKDNRETITSQVHDTSGLTMGNSYGIEIHLKDNRVFPETGFNFYFFPPGEETAEVIPAPNSCISCHTQNAEYDNIFTQFYPAAQRILHPEKDDAAEMRH